MRPDAGGAMPRIARFILAGDDHQDDADRQTASLAGMAVTLFLVVVALFLINHLRRSSAIEDCLLAGRTNCDQIFSHIR